MDGNIAKHLFSLIFIVKLPSPITERNPKP